MRTVGGSRGIARGGGLRSTRLRGALRGDSTGVRLTGRRARPGRLRGLRPGDALNRDPALRRGLAIGRTGRALRSRRHTGRNSRHAVDSLRAGLTLRHVRRRDALRTGWVARRLRVCLNGHGLRALRVPGHSRPWAVAAAVCGPACTGTADRPLGASACCGPAVWPSATPCGAAAGPAATPCGSTGADGTVPAAAACGPV
ncbi:hypothetical protein ACU686_40870 [Yinghuangia aomiensis]